MKQAYFYGEVDWMTRGVVDSLKREGQLSQDTKVVTVEDCGHQLFFENPTASVRELV